MDAGGAPKASRVTRQPPAIAPVFRDDSPFKGIVLVHLPPLVRENVYADVVTSEGTLPKR